MILVAFITIQLVYIFDIVGIHSTIVDIDPSGNDRALESKSSFYRKSVCFTEKKCMIYSKNVLFAEKIANFTEKGVQKRIIEMFIYPLNSSVLLSSNDGFYVIFANEYVDSIKE